MQAKKNYLNSSLLYKMSIDTYSSGEILKIFKAKAFSRYPQSLRSLILLVNYSIKCCRCQQHIPANEGVDVILPPANEDVDVMTVRDDKYLDIKLCRTCATKCSIHDVMLSKQKIEEIAEMIRQVKTRTEWDEMVRRVTLDCGLDS